MARGEPTVGTYRLQRDRYLKKLKHLLSCADFEAFTTLLWAVDALQSGRVQEAARYITFPPEVATADKSSGLAVYPWDLETLYGLRLVIPELRLRDGPNRILNCSTFESARVAVNWLREVESSESGMYLPHLSIHTEMHRIGHRQFTWQRGYFDTVTFYRNTFVYGHGECASYFLDSFGISIDDFSLIGFLLHSMLLKRPAITRVIIGDPFGITQAKFDAAYQLMTLPVAEAAKQLRNLLDGTAASNYPVAYRPSILRRFPILAFGNDASRLRTPLISLILSRVTGGLYYDMVRGGSSLLRYAAERFEIYTFELADRMLLGYTVKRGIRYETAKGFPVETPDVLIFDKDGFCKIVLECKATKLTLPAQYSDNPYELAKRGFDEIAHGIYQIWRFYSHIRRGVVVPTMLLANENFGIVVTMDPWFSLSNELRKEVLNRAKLMASKDKLIIEDDQKDIVICSIDDLETTLRHCQSENFISSLRAACTPKYFGWPLQNVLREMELVTEIKPYPFDLQAVLPWWERTRQQLQRGRTN